MFIFFIILAVLNEYSSDNSHKHTEYTEISVDKDLLNAIIHSQQIQEAQKSARVIEPIDIEDPSYPQSSGNRHLVKVFSTFHAFNKEPSSYKSILKYKEKMPIQLQGKILTSGQSENIKDMFVIDNPNEHIYLVFLRPDLDQNILMPPKSYVATNSLKDVEKLIDIAIFKLPSRDPVTMKSSSLYEYYTLNLKNISGYHAVIYNIGGLNTYLLSSRIK